jgi:uncharacterized YigZ family protein
MADYITVEGTATGTVVEKKSEFIGYITHVESEREADAFLASVRKKDYDARHHCYAYILREGAVRRQSDDGEPQKTAGMPILEVLRHSQLEDVIIVVTRYFGGTLLGTGGLVRAYTRAAQRAVENASILHYRSCRDLDISIDYTLYDRLVNTVRLSGAKVISTDFTDKVRVVIRTLDGQQDRLAEKISRLTKGIMPQISGRLFDTF